MPRKKKRSAGPFVQQLVAERARRGIPRHVDLIHRAIRVRKVYIRERRIFEGEVSLPSPGFDVCPSNYVPSQRWEKPMAPSETNERRGKVWRELAKMISSHGWDVQDYIRMGFDLQPIPDSLEPDELLDWEARTRYIIQGHDHKRAKIQEEMAVQQKKYERWLFGIQRAVVVGRTRRSVKKLLHDVLLVAEVEPFLSPLFRVCMAARYDMQDVAEHYWEAAAWSYYRHKADYDLACWDFVPTGLKRDAGRLYREALVRMGLDDASL